MSPHLPTLILHLVRVTKRILARIENSTYQESWTIRWLLCSLKDALLRINQSVDVRSEHEVIDKIKWLSVQNTVQTCRHLLKALDGLIKISAQDGSSSGSQEQKNQRVAITEKLFDNLNTLTLTLHPETMASFVQSLQDLRQFQSRLEESCKWLCNQELLSLELKDLPERDTHLTFKLEEAEMATTTSLPPRTEFVVVCPRASLPAVDAVRQTPLKLRFICHCPNADHRSVLSYTSFGVRGIPTEVVSPSSNSIWKMCCRKTDAVVTVHLSDLSPTHIDQLEALSSHLARALSASAAFNHKDEVLRSSEKAISVLRMKGTPALSHLKILTVKFFVTDAVSRKRYFKIPWTPKYLQLLQYATMDKEQSSAAINTYSNEKFRAEPSFLIFLSEQHPMSETVGGVPFEHFKVKVYRETSVKDLSACRTVVIADVYCGEDINSPESLRCSEVHLEFSESSEATIFFQYIRNMQEKLLEKSLQEPLRGEDTVLRCASDLSLSTSSLLTGIRIMIVYSPSSLSAKYRLIAVRDDNSYAICYELEGLCSDNGRRSLADTFPSQFVWTICREDCNGISIRKQEWKELRGYSKKEISIHARGSGPALAREHESSSSKWFNEIDDVNLILRAHKYLTNTDRKYKLVRIAVIDTGFDKNPKHQARCQIDRYKDFVAAEKASDGKGVKDKAGLGNVDDPLESLSDLTGHGTTSVEAILRVYQKARLYVARVFKSDSANDKMEQYLMADAITWAVKHEVDIISISAGFQEGVAELHQAVSKAVKNDIIIFASAANWSYADRPAVPARLRNVFCIFSTDAGFKNSRTYNPPALENDHNFAILGENVRISPDKGSVSGTSISTAIAAGFAARIIDFTRQPDCRNAIKCLVSPETEPGMAAILKALANKDGGYECIRPLRILTYGGTVEISSDHATNRERVIEFLCRILREAM